MMCFRMRASTTISHKAAQLLSVCVYTSSVSFTGRFEKVWSGDLQHFCANSTDRQNIKPLIFLLIGFPAQVCHSMKIVVKLISKRVAEL